ncbi:hypothetical protein K3495_g6238 [Podosphaera aphanis]|nr:hypothetical protein K3495_g6238 [Podosphaera aphanis]
MASTPLIHVNTGISRLTPSNPQYTRPARSPNTSQGFFESGLSLQKIIGTTVSSPTSFDSIASLRVFAYTAGAAAVVVNSDDLSNHSHRFFRARPTVIPLNHSTSCASTNASNDGRHRSIGSHRDSGPTYSPLSSQNTTFEWGDSSGSKAWNTREKIKAATCLSLSRNGKLLAVGETGHAPRVLVFSLQDPSSNQPFIILNEHSYGIRAVAFSPDCRYLASLGVTNDGFLYIWSINQKTCSAKLLSTNKCTSVVKQMVWLGNSSLVTIGTRHVKIWRMSEKRSCASPPRQKFNTDSTINTNLIQAPPRTLAGRNVILGSLVEATFTAIAVISDDQAIVCSEKGDLCLIDDRNGPKLHKLTNAGFPATCLAADLESRRLMIGGKNGSKLSICLDDLLTSITPPNSPTPTQQSSTDDPGHICAMGYVGGSLITVDSNHLVEVSRLDCDTTNSKVGDTPLPAHSDAVLGVHALSENKLNADFLTWSANGTVVFWDLSGTKKYSLKVDYEQFHADDEPINQCSNLCASNGVKFLAYGDKYGVLRTIEPLSQQLLFETRAHATDINCIALYENPDPALMASCGRDRMIQLFEMMSNKWTLVQTLDEHTASVTDLFFAEKGEKLISSSTDRTVHIRQIVNKVSDGRRSLVILPLRIITLRASPVSMAPCFDNGFQIIVSLHDRTVAKYEILTGRLLSSFKASDNEGIEAVSLDSIVVGTPHQKSARAILAGVSSTDKSVRVYDESTGTLIDREWGHSTNVTDVALLQRPNSDSKSMISTGSDGTIMIWSLSPKITEEFDSIEPKSCTDNTLTPKETPITRAPLRRVLSKADLAEYQRTPPAVTPTGRRSPPRATRRKFSRYSLRSQTTSLMPSSTTTTPKILTSPLDEVSVCREKIRVRSRSPPTSPKSKSIRRQSLISPAETKARTKNPVVFSEFESLNLATEQACHMLRTYRKKLLSSEPIKETLQKKLDHELRLTAVALGEKSQKSRTINETVLTGLLDEYSDRLVSLFDEKLRTSRLASNEYSNENSQGPQRAGSSPV